MSFEEMIYNRKDGKIPTPSSGGWHVYKPCETVSNLRLSPWSGGHDPQKEFNEWSKRTPQEDIQSVSSGGSVPKFAVVPARSKD